MATITTDPKAAILLDFISVAESRGNYNAVIGNAHSTQDLSKRTIFDVYVLQRMLLSDGMPSGAVGRYQIIGKTLRGLVAQMGLDPQTAYFTPMLQDQMAITLLITRGYRQWWLGEMTDEEFAHRLSMEWASLPDPANGGRSHYEGDSAGNHAGATLQKVYATLEAARNAPARGPETGPIPQVSQVPPQVSPQVSQVSQVPEARPWWKLWG